MALVAGQDIAKLEPGYFYGYGVDSGTGSFADPEAMHLINEASDPEIIFFNEISAEMDEVYSHTRSWVHINTPRGSAALFSSGFGDGMSASYFGLDEENDVVALISDFGVLDWPRPM